VSVLVLEARVELIPDHEGNSRRAFGARKSR